MFNSLLLEELQVKEKELKTIGRALQTAKEDEARRISRELHDELGQNLTMIILRLKKLLEYDKVEDIHNDVIELQDIAREMINAVQRIAKNLRPATLEHLGLLPSINEYLEQFRVVHSLEIDYRHSTPLKKLSEEQELLIYRVLLEILTNISRHARATRVEIELGQNEEELLLRVEDDGIGMDWKGSCSMGLGLKGIKERVEAQGGRLLLESQVGKGTTVKISIQ